MTTKSLTLTDLQFSGNDAVSAKLRRLVHDFAAAQQAVNALINSVNTLSSAQGSTVLFENGAIAPGFTAEGLTAGTFLKALSATSAAFEQIKLADLSDVADTNPTAGEVLTYQYGEWVPAPIPPTSGGATGTNIGVGQKIYAGIIGASLAFHSIEGDGSTIAVNFSGDTLVISYIGPTTSVVQAGAMGPPGMDGDPGEDGMMGPPGVGGGAVVTSGFTYQQAAALVSMRM